MKRAFVAFACVLVACKAQPALDSTLAPASPQASAEPAPLANVPAPLPSTSPHAAAWFEGPPPVPMRGDRAIEADVPSRDPYFVAESNAGREIEGFTLEATLHPGDIAPVAKVPEANAAGHDAARRKLDSRVTIDLFGTRMRMVLEGAFALAGDTEIRARSDRLGHVVLAPGGGSYRIAAPGALRAVVGERRFDVAPVLAAEIVPRGEGAKRFGSRVRKVDVTTRAGRAMFEIAHVDGAAEAGVLVCRALLDLMNAPPTTPLCATDDVPVRAELRWTTRGSLTFDVTSLVRRPEMLAAGLAAPPPKAVFADAPLPEKLADVLLFESELAALRSAPFDAPPAKLPLPPDVEGGLVLVNATDQLRFAWLDGLPVAWLAPGMRRRVAGLQRGRYTLQWRTFLGDGFDPAQTVTVPGVSQVGGGDGGI